MKRIVTAALAAASISLVGCDDLTSNNDAGAVTLGFSTAPSAGSSLVAGSSSSVIAADSHELVLTGSNGTLSISDIRFIVNEFEMEQDEAACEGLDGAAEEACEEFETGLAFVQLPLNGALAPLVTQAIPAGSYVELEFEVEDVDLDEAADDEEGAEIAALIQAIEAAGFSDWPDNASLVVVGTFTPNGGEARSFRAYFEAEIEVEMEFNPPLVIDGQSGTVDIHIDPAAWFTNPDGTVMDLSAFDFASTGHVLEFEVEMENGFTEIELDGFDD